MGEKKTPEAFRNSCDEFIFLENLGRANELKLSIPKAGDDEYEEDEPEEDYDIEKIHNLLKIASDKYQDDEGFVNVSSAGQFIKRVRPDFDVRTFGYLKLPKLIEAFPDRYEIKKYQGKGTVLIIAYRCK